MKKFETFHSAYKHMLKDLRTYGHECKPRGRHSKELLGHGFILTNPRNRIIAGKRNTNVFFLVGNLLWILSQSNELDFIEYYNPRGVNFSDDGKILRGAYGKRIFDIDGVNQWQQCIKELKLDKHSRRAAITLHLPQHDWHGSLDTPCTFNFQMFIRDNKLHLINHMRSQSAALVMNYDVFVMTMLQEYASIILGVELGEYHHYCGSIHYYIEEEKFVDTLISDNSKFIEMDRMPKETNQEMIKKILLFEKKLRKSTTHLRNSNLVFFDEKQINYSYFKEMIEDLPKYWKDICTLLLVKSAKELEDEENYSLFLDELKETPYYQFF